MKRLLSIILAFVLVFSLYCTPAFAESLEDTPADTDVIDTENTSMGTDKEPSAESETPLIYTSLGDSTSNGYGMNEYYTSGRVSDPRIYKYNKVVAFAYPSMFSRAINATTLYQDCVAGLRSEDLLYLIDPQNYSGDAFSEHVFREDVMWQLSKDGITGFSDLSNRYIKHITDADVITLNIGLNNFGEFLITQTIRYQNGKQPYSVTLDPETANTLNTPLFKAIKAAFNSIMVATGNPIGLVDVLIESLAYTYNDNLKCFDKIVDRIYELNPDVELYVFGLYDCFNDGLYLTNNTVDLGQYNRSLMQDVNNHYRTYSTKYTYIDIIDTEIFGLPHNVIGTNFFYKLGEDNSKLSHPNYDGHRYMYNQLAAKATENGWNLRDYSLFDPDAYVMLPFNDVFAGDWYYDGVRYCYINGITRGTSGNTFSPNVAVTRAQLATFIYRMAGMPTITNKNEPFDDVSDSYWAHDAIAWAYNHGIIKGFSDTKFSPNSCVTRGQAVTMLCRYACPISSSSSFECFDDASSIPTDYQYAVSWAVDNGIIKGYTDGTFRQSVPLSRAQMTVMIQRLCESN